MLDDFELLILNLDLSNILGEVVYGHRGVNAEDLWASEDECEYVRGQ